MLTQLQEVISDAEARWQFALEGAGDGIWDWNIEADETYYSRQWKAMLGYAEDEIGSSPEEWELRIHPEDRERVQSAVEDHLAGRTQVYVSEYRVQCKDGTYKWILGRGKVVNRTLHGRPLRMIGTHTDITERREAEEQRLKIERRLLQTQKLESLGILAGGVAHDFNNLLTAILGNLELAQMELPPGSAARGPLQSAAEAARRAADLTRQMLAYSGKGQFVIEKIDLSRFIEENSSLISLGISKTVALSFNLAPNLPPISADRGQIQQVLINLVTNASEAIGERAGVIKVATGIVVCDDACLSNSRVEVKPPAGEFVYIDISDTGCGMEDAVKDRIFDPFFTTKFIGRGLGLPAVLGILRGHGGAILVGSEPGAGTTIRVLFPVSREESQQEETRTTAPGEAPASESGQQRRRQRRKLLLVDDEELLRDLARSMVEHLGYDVMTAADGREAVSIYRRHADEFDGIILDLSMPNMNGFAAFSEIRRLRPDARVILSSGYSEQEATCQFIGHGLSAFLQKPFNMQSLSATISQVMGTVAAPLQLAV